MLTDLGTLGGTFGFANWISDAGEIAGGATIQGDQALHAFVWRNGIMTDLGTLPGDSCSASLALNSRGQIVGQSFSCVANPTFRAFLWENGGPMLDLNTLIPSGSGVQLVDAVNINDRGEIAGSAVLPSGDTHAILLVPCAKGDEACEDNAADTTAAIQNDSAPVVQRPSTATPANPALSGREMLDWLRSRWGQRYRFPGSGTGPTN